MALVKKHAVNVCQSDNLLAIHFIAGDILTLTISAEWKFLLLKIVIEYLINLLLETIY